MKSRTKTIGSALQSIEVSLKNMMDKKVINQAETLLPTEWGEFKFSAFTDDKGDPMPHLALYHPDIDLDNPVTTRVHSECLTGDIFHSLKCDCGQQLDASMKIIAREKGILIYLRQEGRGIGIINKILAYKHQEQGMDTIEANQALGLAIDDRDYSVAAHILKSLGIKSVNLITNNPEKINGLKHNSIKVNRRVPLIIKPNKTNQGYLDTKAKSMGHLL